MDKSSVQVGECTLELRRGDITKQETEAVVNAANKQLAPGGGVAGAIHRAAGPQIWEECQDLGGCETGQAKLTSGYDLPASYIIHTVGPVYSDSERDPELLAASYRNSLDLAEENDIESLSFPALSTGAFGYPVQEAADIALETILDYLAEKQNPKLIRLVLYGQADFETHQKTLDRIINDSDSE